MRGCVNFSLVLLYCSVESTYVFAGPVVIGWGNDYSVMACCYVTFTANAVTHVYAFVLSTLIYALPIIAMTRCGNVNLVRKHSETQKHSESTF